MKCARDDCNNEAWPARLPYCSLQCRVLGEDARKRVVRYKLDGREYQVQLPEGALIVIPEAEAFDVEWLKGLRSLGVEAGHGVLPGSPSLWREALAQAAVRVLVVAGADAERASAAVREVLTSGLKL